MYRSSTKDLKKCQGKSLIEYSGRLVEDENFKQSSKVPLTTTLNFV
jgi:hypothetical protein